MENKKKLELRFAIALPFVDMNTAQYNYLLEYNRISHRAGSIATTPSGAVSKYLFRVIKPKARVILAFLRDRLGGAGNYAMQIPDVFKDEQGDILTGIYKEMAQELEVAHYFFRCHERSGQSPLDYLGDAQRVLWEFERIRRRQRK